MSGGNWIYTPSTTTTHIATSVWYPYYPEPYWNERKYCANCGWYWGWTCKCQQEYWDKYNRQQELERKMKNLQREVDGLEKEIKRLKKIPRDNTQVFLNKRRGK